MQFVDTLQNLVSGMFMGKDKLSADQYVLTIMDRAQQETAYRGDWIARKVIDIPPSDMVREWRDWQAEQDQIEAIEAEEKRLDLKRRARRALVRARLYGGAAIILGVKQGEPAEELRVEGITKGALQYVHVVSRHEISAGEINRDVMSPSYGEPLHYDVFSQNQGSVRIHASRVIRLIGAELPNIDLAYDGWGDSVLQSINDAVHHAGLASQGIAGLIHEAKVDVIKVPHLMANLTTAGYSKRLTERFALANLMKSINNTLILDSEEEWDRKQTSFAQLPELLSKYLQIAAGAADIPATRMLGQAPSGMNATGDSDIRNYYDRIKSDQSDMLTPALDRLDEVMIRSVFGVRDPAIHYAWTPLWQMSEADKATIAKTKAETTQIYVNTALVPVEAMATAVTNQLVEDGTYPGFEQAMEGVGQLDLEDIPEPDEVPPKIVSDAAPRTLYVRRDVVNRADIVRWAREQGFGDITADLHVTIAFSRSPVDWFVVGTSWSEKLDIAAGGPRQMDRLGPDGKYIALLITANELVWRHREIVEAGASWDWPEYQPHISIQTGGDIDLAEVEPYQGRIVLGPEIFEEVREG